MATLSGNKIKDTYQSLIKLTDNGNLTTGAKQVTDGFGNNSPLYISTTQVGIGVTPEATYDLHVYSNAKVGGNLTITGDLTVNGTTTTVDTDTLRVEDPLIEVARNNTSADSVDIGIYGKYAPSATTLYAGLFRDAGDDKFKLFKSLEEEPTTTVNTSGTGYTKAGLVIGNLEATQVDLGDSEKIRFGASQDLEIYHDGTTNDSIIKEAGAGGLKLLTNTIQIRNAADTETILQGSENGSVSLYYNNISKLYTDNLGITLTDNLFLTAPNYISFNAGAGLDYVIKKNGLDLEFNTGGDFVFLSGQMKLDTYGSGTYTGTATYRLAVDSSGDVIEIPIGDGAVDGSGTANTVTMWSDTDTITDAPITISGNDATFAGNVGLGGTGIYASGISLNIDGTGLAIKNNVNGSNNNWSYIHNTDTGSSSNLVFATGAATALTLAHNGDATFSSIVTANGFRTTSGSTDYSLLTRNSSNTAVYIQQAGAGNILDVRYGSQAAGQGTSAMVVNGTGSVGIGATSPDFALDIEAASSGVQLQIGRTVTSAGSTWMGSDSNGFHLGVGAYGAGNSVSDPNGFTVDTSGNVGIGTSSPNTILEIASGNSGGDAALDAPVFRINNTTESSDWDTDDVVGSIEYYTSDDSGNAPYVTSFIKSVNETGNGTLPDGALTFGTATYNASGGAVERMRIDSSGAVGIGVTPESNRFASHDVLQVGARATLLANDTVSLTGQTALLDNLYYDSSGNFQHRGNAAGAMVQMYEGNIIFQNSNQTSGTPTVSERMRITSGGNVGIGTDSPTGSYTKTLHIHGSSTGASLHITDPTSGATASDGLEVFQYGTDAYIWEREAGNLRFGTSATERMRIDSSGDVGINTTNPTEKLFVGSGNIGLNDGYALKWGSSYIDGVDASDILRFYTSSTERVRVSSDGDIYFNTIGDPNGTSVYGSGFVDAGSGIMQLRQASSTSSSVSVQRFYNPNGNVGSIQLSGSATSFVTSSDYRLKENVVEMTGALDRVSNLKPSRFNFIGQEEIVDGFLAHEVQEIVPEAITGTKDEVDAEGNPVYQGIDQSKLVPLLVGAIQELKAEIETLKAQINN